MARGIPTVKCLNRRQRVACAMFADGKTKEDVLLCVFGVNESSDPEKRRKAKKELRKWMNMPEFVEEHKEIVKLIGLEIVPRSVKRLSRQIDDPNGWLANKACNDVLAKYGQPYFGDGDKDKTVVVRVEGMPVLGLPEDDTADDGADTADE